MKENLFTLIAKSVNYNYVSSVPIYNHLDKNYQLSNKKSLFKNLKMYYSSIGQDMFNFFPLTFLIKSKDNIINFNYFYDKNVGKNENIWILKPGENSNRGRGIFISNNLRDINNKVSEIKKNKTIIIQKYIEHPLLINNRKFDIRCFILVTSYNRRIKGIY